MKNTINVLVTVYFLIAILKFSSVNMNSFIRIHFCVNAGRSFDGRIYTSAALMSRLDLENGVNTAVEDIPFKSMMVASIPAADFDWIVTLSDGIWKYDGKNFTRFSTEADELLESCNVNRAYGFEGDIRSKSVV